MCYCNPTFDIRCTCWVENHDGTKNKDFLKCPMRCETAYERIMNEYKYYKMIEKDGFDSIKKEILKITKLSEKDWDTIKYLYYEYNKEDTSDDESE
jgi:hypothetical protein